MGWSSNDVVFSVCVMPIVDWDIGGHEPAHTAGMEDEDNGNERYSKHRSNYSCSTNYYRDVDRSVRQRGRRDRRNRFSKSRTR